MIKLKSANEIEVMAEGGRRLRQVISRLLTGIRSGLTTEQINKQADKLILEAGGQAAFKQVPGYHWATCLSVNEQVVHTPPNNRRLIPGDLLTIDIGMLFRGWYTDFATTIIIDGKKDPKKAKILRAGEQALAAAIKQIAIGKRIGDISLVINQEITRFGFKVITQLTGHGIGRQLHEDPALPGFVDRPIDATPVIKPGLTLAIEVIYAETTNEVIYENNDQWSLITADGSLSACFEKTVAVGEKNVRILT